MNPTPRRVDPLIAELEQESAATKRLLDCIPADKLDWRPHDKSMTIGQLAHHVAGIPGNITNFLEVSEFDAASANFTPPQPASLADVLAAYADGLEAARIRLNALDDTRADQPWRLHRSGTDIMTMPKLAVMRYLLLNHLYHHRGQLTVYLRLLNVPLPITYGRSADTNPFG